MAIKKNINLDNGVFVNEAYCRIENIAVEKDKMNFNLRYYVCVDKPFFNEQHLSCSYDIEGANPFVQAYEYLKTLEEFQEIEDC